MRMYNNCPGGVQGTGGRGGSHTHMEGCTQVIYDGEVVSRDDIDTMEEAIRSVRMTSLDKQQRVVTRRCNVLETAAYMSVRFSLLRWISPPSPRGDSDAAVDEERISCSIGSGIVLRCTNSPGSPPRVAIVLVHSDNDGTLPVATPPPAKRGKKRGVCGGGDDEEEASARGKGRGVGV